MPGYADRAAQGTSLADILGAYQQGHGRREMEKLMAARRQRLGEEGMGGVDEVSMPGPADVAARMQPRQRPNRAQSIAFRRQELMQQGLSAQEAIAQMAKEGSIDPRLGNLLLGLPRQMQGMGF